MSDQLPLNLYRAAQVRELDRLAIEEQGIPGYTLMTRAAEATFAVIQQRWPEAKQMVCFCGAGNNGGDGYVIARLALEAGWQVTLCGLKPINELSGEASLAAEDWVAVGGACTPLSEVTINPEAIVVDALLGTGLERAATGDYLQTIEQINSHPGNVVAVDLPSGLHADSGTVLGTAVRADVTTTYVGLKRGLFTADGVDYCGKVTFNDLGVPQTVYDQLPAEARRLQLNPLPRRKCSTHKGECGHVLVIGGDTGFSGAVRMAAEAAARVGAGLVSVATRAQHAAIISSARPELMSHAVESLEELKPLLDWATVIVIGPGLGRNEWGRHMWRAVEGLHKPLVVDADALTHLAENPDVNDQWVLTPHPGEAARLLGESTATIQADRFGAVEQIQKRYGGVALLKGAGTLISDDQVPIGLCDQGNPGMASGGMGDVLCGVIAGLIAQGLSPNEAAEQGAVIHAMSADRAVATAGERGLLATDLMPHLRRLVNIEKEGSE